MLYFHLNLTPFQKEELNLALETARHFGYLTVVNRILSVLS